MSTALTHTTKLKVKFHECDPLRIVWHGNYLKYFEEGREDFCHTHGISYLDAERNGYATPIVSSSCEHKKPLSYGDKFTVETSFENAASAKMIFTYKIFKNEELICTGRTVQVFLDQNNELSLINPEFYQAWKSKMNL
ncbi:thioesterase family protein [uncultured Christiangramia sp.]|uniref:acyl-CoA thioesterase n=1 Tax=uncultured Christiangramia sp. TaxID=503836 RepID=UPI0025CD6FCB|nr:thioesterase family protein [uncultured Christiangramia sp.]|tara:strand:+ start:471 stop:884 length:414 start_codon:yes stop_codon:yes gene_type:complete